MLNAINVELNKQLSNGKIDLWDEGNLIWSLLDLLHFFRVSCIFSFGSDKIGNEKVHGIFFEKNQETAGSRFRSLPAMEAKKRVEKWYSSVVKVLNKYVTLLPTIATSVFLPILSYISVLKKIIISRAG